MCIRDSPRSLSLLINIGDLEIGSVYKLIRVGGNISITCNESFSFVTTAETVTKEKRLKGQTKNISAVLESNSVTTDCSQWRVSMAICYRLYW